MMYRIQTGLIVAGLLLACGPASARDTVKTPHVVHIANFAFAPQTLTIAPGESVRFVNDDAEPHTVSAWDSSFDSGGLDRNESWQRTFAGAGTYAFFCEFHPNMKGSVVVRSDAGAKR